VTKRRPWWSDRLRWVAIICGGLLLLNVSPVAAANGKVSVKKTESATANRSALRHHLAKAGKKPARPVVRGVRTLGRNNLKNRRHDALAPEVLTAELKDDEATGLRGAASFYAYGFQGRRTATGELFKPKEFTAASNHFPLGTMVAVRRLDNSLCAIVKVNDRMHAKHRRRIIDVSRGVAEYLEMIRAGVVLVSVAPLRKGWKEQGMGACHSAFEAEPPCPDCAQPPPKFPEFGGDLLR